MSFFLWCSKGGRGCVREKSSIAFMLAVSRGVLFVLLGPGMGWNESAIDEKGTRKTERPVEETSELISQELAT